MNESSAIILLLAAIFTNNILLSNFLGMCSFLACSRQVHTAAGLGAAVLFVMAATTPLNYFAYQALRRYHCTYLTLIVFIAIIAAFVQFVEMFVERFSPRLYFSLGIFLPLITVNCAIYGVVLFMVVRRYTLLQAVAFSLGAGLGWALAIILMAGLQQKLAYSDVPRPFRGVAISMVVTGILAMAFQGFTGMFGIQ